MHKTKKLKRLSLFLLTVLGICIFGAGSPALHAANSDDLIIGGMSFGMRISIDGAMVVGMSEVGGNPSPASAAGLRRGDIITSADGEPVSSSRELIRHIEQSEDNVDVTFIRAGKERHASISPVPDGEGRRKIGVLTRDSAAGIGTVTYIDPKTLMFVGLGHGVCDGDSGALLPTSYGSVEDIEITGITPGKSGIPGELRGVFTGRRIGRITKNCDTGVYGMLSELPECADMRLPTAKADEVRDGKAQIRSEISGTPELYDIEISLIGDGAQKNFSIKVTDERLLDMTGGIVQGMSGSPIIQNGKLIGAVTHVLVGDSASGYGIFIGNMLDNASAVSVYEDSAA